MFIFTRFLLFSHKTPADFMNYLRFLSAFFILSICFSCKKKEVKPNSSKYIKIPDINFEKALIELKIDDVQDGQILTMNAEKEDSLDIYSKKIKSLEGIEAFTNLVSLDFSNNQLKSINISKNTKLMSLYGFYNQLTTLDLSQNIALEQVFFPNNQLTTIDVSKNTELYSLRIGLRIWDMEI